MPSLDALTFAVVSIWTVLLVVIGLIGSSTKWERATLIGLLGGLFLYNGVGVSYSGMPRDYVECYLLFAAALVLAFRVFALTLGNWSRSTQTAMESLLRGVDQGDAWRILMWVYVGLHLVPLLYPEFRIQQLLAPPSPDLTSLFAARWISTSDHLILRLAEYAIVLMTPFFYVGLYRLRRSLGSQLIVLGLLAYVQYVGAAYIGRGTVVTALAIVWLSTWMERPGRRARLLVGAVLLVPVILMASHAYSIARIGGTVTAYSAWDGAATVVVQETSFPAVTGVALIESGARVDLGRYVTWIATLPIPKVFVGGIEGARVNYEISEVVLGRARGDSGYYVVLPGVVAESVYLFGASNFWLHAMFIAALAAIVIKTVERSPQMTFLAAYVVVMLTYNLNRAGISSVLPTIVNGFLLFAAVVVISILRSQRRTYLCQRPRVPSQVDAGAR